MMGFLEETISVISHTILVGFVCLLLLFGSALFCIVFGLSLEEEERLLARR